MDKTPDEAVKRMADALESLSKEPGFGTAERAFYERLAVRIVNGIVPYINGRDALLEEQLNQLASSVATQQQQITSVQNVANSARAAADQATQRVSQPATTTPPRTNAVSVTPTPTPSRPNFLSRLTRRIFG